MRAKGLTSDGRQALLTSIEPAYWFGEIEILDLEALHRAAGI